MEKKFKILKLLWNTLSKMVDTSTKAYEKNGIEQQ